MWRCRSTLHLVGLELGFLVGTTVQPALDAVWILLTHRAENNTTFVLCGNHAAEELGNPDLC